MKHEIYSSSKQLFLRTASIATHGYAYDISGRLTSRTDALNQTTSYTYGTDNRITKIAYTNPVNPTPTVSLTWDRA